MAAAQITVNTHHRSPSQPLHPQPSSPTLTNPDMILPDYDDGTSPTPISDWKQSAVPGDLRLHEFNFNGFNISGFTIGSGPATPTTPILYGNGTMLSDIGEVTEIESSAGAGAGAGQRARYDDASDDDDEDDDDDDDDFPAQITPTMEAIRNRAKAAAALRLGRKDSIDSMVTITDEHATHFSAIDDAFSMADSNFQGDDEDSVAESRTDDAVPPPRRRSNLDQSQNRYSTSTLSKRAEAILASAKKRLTNMEKHLYSARTSLETSSGFESPPSSSVLGAVHPAPSFRDGTSGSRHYRGLSEDSIQFVGSSRQASTHPIKRSASVLGTCATPGGYRPLLLAASRSIDGGFGRPSRSPGLEINLEPLTEDADSPADQSSPPNSGNAWGGLGASLLSPTENSYSYSSYSYPERGPSRSSSAQQMRSVRDIKDHMMELRGKISSLREQARADSMRRKSIQNVRTPSPFTNATLVDHGYTSGSSAPELTAPLSPSPPSALHGALPAGGEGEHWGTPTALVPPPATPSSEDDGVVFEDSLEDINNENDVSDMCTQDGYEDVDATSMDEQKQRGHVADLDLDHDYDHDHDEAYESEGDGSLYHDTVPAAQLSHEDRADAFDYEHFFLHSALGSFSQEGLGQRSRSNSLGSDVSVETTRADAAAATSSSADRPQTAKRDSRESIDTVQSYETAQTFATANDGSSAVDVDVYSLHNVPIDSDSARGSLGHSPVLSTHRPATVAHMYHRPSIVSIESGGSAGTARSFPLVNNNNINSGYGSAALSADHVAESGILTPRGSPDNLGRIAESLMDDAASICESFTGNSAKMQDLLSRDDQILVQRLVASLGKCVLSLGESGPTSPESRAYRRRIDLAIQILQGTDDGGQP